GVFAGWPVDLAATVARIDEGAEADAAARAGLARRDIAEQVRDHPLRQVVGLDLAGDGERLELRHQAPVPADHALDQPAVPEVVEPARLAVALAGGIDERQPARRAAARLGLGRE